MERCAIPVLAFAMFLLGGFAILVPSSFGRAAQEMTRMVALRRGSRETTGVVAREWKKSSTDTASYTFAAGGVALAGECSMPFLSRLREGDPLPIRFLPSDPAINHPVAWDGPGSGLLIVCVFSAVFPALGIWLVIQLRRDRRLLAEGVPAAGVIVKRSGGLIGGWATEYRFRTEDGRVAEGRGVFSDRQEIGSTVCVLYLPQDPRRYKPCAGLSYRLAQ